MLEPKKRKNIMLEAVTVYGTNIQQAVAMEELAELSQEISKFIRGEGSMIHLIEEMADVYIMLEQLKLMHDISDKEIEDEMNFKLVRLKERINNISRGIVHLDERIGHETDR